MQDKMDEHKKGTREKETSEKETHKTKEYTVPRVKKEESLETLVDDFQKVYSDLIPEKSLEMYTEHLEKLYRSLTIVREKEKKLTTECKRLKAEIISNTVKLEEASKRSLTDQATIVKLESDIDQAKTLIQECNEKEERDNNTINGLQEKVDNFNKMIAAEELLTPEQVHRVGDLLTDKEQLTAERDNLQTELNTLQENFKTTTNELHEANEANVKAQELITQQQQDLQVCRDECSNVTQENKRLEKELNQCHADIQDQRIEIKRMKVECKTKTEEAQRMGKELHKQMALKGAVSKELEQLKESYILAQNKNNQMSLKIERLESKNAQMEIDLKEANTDVNRKTQEIAQLNKIKETAQRKLGIVENQKMLVEQQNQALKTQNTGLEKRIEKGQKEIVDNKNQIQKLNQEKDMLSNKLVKSESEVSKQQKQLKQQDQTLNNLNEDILNYKKEIQKQTKVITETRKERDSNMKEVNELKEKIMVFKDSSKMQETKIEEYKQKIAEGHAEIQKQKNMYNAMSLECHINKKNLNKARSHITELKHKIKSMDEEKDQLTEIIQSKESELAKKNQELECMEKKNAKLHAELQKMEQQAQEAKQCINEHEIEKHRLLKILADADAEKARLSKELQDVRLGRDRLCIQLAQRSEQLAKLAVKSDVQASILQKGEIEYDKRMEDISMLKKEWRKYEDLKTVCESMTKDMIQLGQELDATQNELFRWQARCKKLQEELENPMNVHRWRKLEGTDPDIIKLTQKVDTLQRSLLAKTNEVEQKDYELQENKKLCANLERKLAHQLSQSSPEKLADCQRKINTMSDKIKVLTAERNMYMADVKDYEKMIESFKNGEF